MFYQYDPPQSVENYSYTMPSEQPRGTKRNVSEDDAEAAPRKSSKTNKSTTYSPNLEMNLIDHGIFPFLYDHEDEVDRSPKNLQAIKSRLGMSRDSNESPSSSPSDFQELLKKDSIAKNEPEVAASVFPIITGGPDNLSGQDVLFSNLEKLTDGNIPRGKPDYYCGSKPTDLNKNIRDELAGFIIPSTDTTRPCLPNFFLEGKGPNGTIAVCKRQALYDGALGARGIHRLRVFINSNASYDENAYTLSATYCSGTLRIYTHHPTMSNSPGREQDYHMTQLKGWDLIGDPDTFAEGIRAFRNARDWAKEQRDGLIAAANTKSRA